MANEIRATAFAGLAVTAQLMAGATPVGAPIALTEPQPGYYLGSVPGGTAAGAYAVLVKNGTTVLGAAPMQWDGTAEVLPATPGAAMALTSGERTTLSAQIEAALLADGDGQAFVNAIVAAIGNVNVNQAVFVAAIRADLERTGGLLDVLPTLTEIEASAILAKQAQVTAIKAKTDLLPAAPAAVGDIPTAATVAAQVRTNLTTELGRIDATISSRESEASAATRASTDQAEHDATQAAVAAIGTGTPVRADIRSINGTPVQGAGISGNKWRPGA